MTNSLPFVWVHLGQQRIPRYLELSLKTFANLFRDQELILLIDKNKPIKNLGIENLRIQRIAFLDDEWIRLKKNLNHDLQFRNEFWFNSLARFKALHAYMEVEKVDKMLHVESDVIFLPNFPVHKFRNLGDKLAYSLQSDGHGIASIFYVGSRAILSDFLRFASEEVGRNGKSTDMTILFNFFESFPEKVFVLPNLSKSNSILENEEHDNTINHPDPREATEYFGGVFDAISIGQYLFGIDPRNGRGKKVLFHEDSTHWVKPSLFRFFWREDSLIAENDGKELEVFNLHVHSKDEKAFSYRSLRKELISNYRRARDGEATEVLWNVFLASAIASLRRKLRIGTKKWI